MQMHMQMHMHLQGKYIAEYVTRQQTLDRDKRAAWRDTQKMQAQADLELAKIRAELEEFYEARKLIQTLVY